MSDGDWSFTVEATRVLIFFVVVFCPSSCMRMDGVSCRPMRRPSGREMCELHMPLVPCMIFTFPCPEVAVKDNRTQWVSCC